MADTLTKKQRSYTMSRIRSKWTKNERHMHNFLNGLKIRHKMHPKIKGSPDIIFPEAKTALFIHGCFWHKCNRCWIKPKSNVEYWLPKIRKNVERDKKNIEILKRHGWKVAIIWEHEIKHEDKKCFYKTVRRLKLLR